MRFEVDLSKVFPNGNYIFKNNGEQIDPKSEEGKTIISILARQHEDRAANAEQREKFIKDTHPRDKAAQDALRKKIGNKPK